MRGARGNNLQNVDADIPLGAFTCVTGVSGGGKFFLTYISDVNNYDVAANAFGQILAFTGGGSTGGGTGTSAAETFVADLARHGGQPNR